jgi:hypothetical protein
MLHEVIISTGLGYSSFYVDEYPDVQGIRECLVYLWTTGVVKRPMLFVDMCNKGVGDGW